MNEPEVDTALARAICRLGVEATAELARAMEKHAPMHSLHEGYAVIFEELDELWDEVRAWQPGSDLTEARKEALQVAAMALRIILDVCDAPRSLASPPPASRPEGQ